MITSALTGITDNPAQTFTIPLQDGTVVSMFLYYIPNQMGWFYNLSWPGNTTVSGITINGRRVVTSPNMLRQYKNEIPFGLGCTTADNKEPFNQNCFLTQYAILFLLDSAAVNATELRYFSVS